MHTQPTHGYALVTALALVVVLTAISAAYFLVTNTNLAATSAQASGTTGYYAAEAGLNVRAARFAALFSARQEPAGAGPQDPTPCVANTPGGQGTLDMACQSGEFGGRTVWTYAKAVPGSPATVRIQAGREFGNLNAFEYRYDLQSRAVGPGGQEEALLGLRFRSQVIPLFQFLAYYNSDLEISPGPSMTLDGPIHTNGNLYLAAGRASVTVRGAVTSAGDIYHGLKAVVSEVGNDKCRGTTQVADAQGVLRDLPGRPSPFQCQNPALTDAQLDAFGGTLARGVQVRQTPDLGILTPTPGSPYWDKADLRVVLNLRGGSPRLEVRDANGLVNTTLTAGLALCNAAGGGRPAAAAGPANFYDARERKNMQLLDIDMEQLQKCMDAGGGLPGVAPLGDATDGGLVFHFSVDGPASAGLNNYGVRLKGGAKLDSRVRGLTVVTDQPMYVQGDFNKDGKKPASIMADALTVLSNNWQDANSARHMQDRRAAETTVNAAFVAGTRQTSPDGREFSGGLHNFPRFLEDWQAPTCPWSPALGQNICPFNYQGSFVSLGEPKHTASAFSNAYYNPPQRNWKFDASFTSLGNLPPLTPVMTYLSQESFTRTWERP